MISTHSQRIEKWMGASAVAQLSNAMRGSYFDPIPIANSHGLKVCRDGDFIGTIKVGYECSFADWAADQEVRARKQAQAAMARAWKQQGAITGLSGLIEAISAGKRQDFNVGKTGATGVVNRLNTLWDVGAQPQAGGISAAPAGSSPTNTTIGGFLHQNATGSDILYFMGATIVPTVGNNLLLLYDRFFQVNHSLATSSQLITGVPTRYQNILARNTFIHVAVTTALGAGTPTLTITYVDQDGNAAEAAAPQTMVASAIARSFPFAATVGNGWFIPLNSGDYGVRALTNSVLSATNTGNIDLVLGKPIAWIPCPVANMPFKMDATMSPMDFAPIEPNACLALVEINKGAATATNYSGSLHLVSG